MAYVSVTCNGTCTGTCKGTSSACTRPCFKDIAESFTECYRGWLENNTVPIVMDDVRCDEDDTNISNCSVSFISHNCDHRFDVWLQCKGKWLDM